MKNVGVVLVTGVVLSVVSGHVVAQDPKFHHLQGGHIEDVFFLDATRGWTAEEGSRLRWTADGGESWTFADTSALEDPSSWVRLKGVFALDLGNDTVKVWAVGEGGVVLVSTDSDGKFFGDANEGARVLNAVGEGDPCAPVGQLADLQDIFMFDGDNGWLVGLDGVLKKTTNGGVTWGEPTGFETPFLFGCGAVPIDAYRIHFFADSGFSKGVLISEFGWVYTTEDAGLTWTQRSIAQSLTAASCPLITGNLELWGLAFDDPDNPDSDMWLSGGIGTSKGYVFKSSGGWPVEEDENSFSWTQLRPYQFTEDDLPHVVNGSQCSLSTMYSIARLDSSSVPALTAGYAGQLLTWETGTANFDPCECEVVVNGPTGDMWVQQDTVGVDPDPCTPKAAYFGTARTGSDSSASVGDFGRITLFADGAQDEIVEAGTEHFVRLLDGKFLSYSHGFVVGQRNTILETIDGGESWEVVGDLSVCNETDFFNAIDFSDDGLYGVAAGNDGVVAYSDDSGAADTWTQYSWPPHPGVTNDFTAVNFVDGTDIVYIVGVPSTVKRSTDGGATWSNVFCPTPDPIYGVSFSSENEGYICGAYKEVFRTVSGGSSWARVTVNGGDSEVLRDIEQWDSGTKAIAVGDSGRVFIKSGGTFEQVDDDEGFPENITSNLHDVEVLNDGDYFWIGGDDGVVLFGDNTGLSTAWTRVRSQTNSPIYKLSFQDVDEGFAIAVSFVITRYE